MAAYQNYPPQQLLVVYDTLSAITTALGSKLDREDFKGIILPPLISKWNSLDDSDEYGKSILLG